MDGWRAARRAAGLALHDRRLWPAALAGFLARGGIVLFVLPVIVPPSLVGLATFIGPASITPDGPTLGLIVRIALAAVVVTTALVAGTFVGALADLTLIAAGSATIASMPGSHRLLGRLVLIRLVSLVPVVVALSVGLQRLGQVTYLELTLPSDLVSPIALRVAARAPDAVVAILVAWLLGEAWGGVAVRVAVLGRTTVIGALGRGLVLFVRRPVSIVALVLGSVLLAVAVIGSAVILISWSWALVRTALLGPGGLVEAGQVLALAALFAACWAVGLTVAAVLATWRSLSLTLTMGEDLRGSSQINRERATL
ncbi:MAG: hypothetical protein ACRDGQ_04360 [Candidatus Limnocylindrales bacterium]